MRRPATATATAAGVPGEQTWTVSTSISVDVSITATPFGTVTYADFDGVAPRGPGSTAATNAAAIGNLEASLEIIINVSLSLSVQSAAGIWSHFSSFFGQRLKTWPRMFEDLRFAGRIALPERAEVRPPRSRGSRFL